MTRALTSSCKSWRRSARVHGEPVLLEVMPIGRLNGAAPWTYVGESATWSVCSLLMRWWIMIDEHSFRLQVQVFVITGIAQKESLAAIADKHDSIVRNFDPGHDPSLLVLCLPVP